MTEQDSPFKGRELFKGRDTSYGIFYPTGYAIVHFDSHETAQRAEQTLLSAGYTRDEVEAVPADYVICDVEKGLNNASFLNSLKQAFSVGAERRYWEADLEHAKQGGGILAIHCPTKHEAERVVRLLKPENPTAMRRYQRLVIEDLI